MFINMGISRRDIKNGISGSLTSNGGDRTINDKGGMHKLVEATLLAYSKLITYAKMYYRFKGYDVMHEDWLAKQKKWIEQDNFWFMAYETYFGYNEENAKKGFIRLIDKSTQKYGYQTNQCND